MAKKKFTFTDLSDDVITNDEPKNEKPANFDLNLSELNNKKENVPNVSINNINNETKPTQQPEPIKEEVEVVQQQPIQQEVKEVVIEEPKIEIKQETKPVEKEKTQTVVESIKKVVEPKNIRNVVEKINKIEESKKQQEIQEQQQVVVKQPEIINPVVSQPVELTNVVQQQPIQQPQQEYVSKYDFNIDYDSEVPIKQQIQEQQKQKTIHTFNETVQMNNNPNIVNQQVQTNTFDNNKIQHFFTAKEKLDVKTNIYLKPNLVNQIQALSKQTGESRSAIINKLIEHALKDIGNN